MSNSRWPRSAAHTGSTGSCCAIAWCRRAGSTSKPTEPFSHRRQITWGDTDSARIVYTARVGHFALEAIEAWFIDRFGAGFYDMNESLGFGTPFVHMAIDFRSRMTPHDSLATRVLLQRVGRSSLHFLLESRAEKDARVCWTGQFVCACVRIDTYEPIPVPEQFASIVADELALAQTASHADY